VYAAPVTVNVAYVGGFAIRFGISCPSAPYFPFQLPFVVVSIGDTNVAVFPSTLGTLRFTVAVPFANPSAAVAVIVTTVATVTVAGAVYNPVLDTEPCAAPVGLTLLIVHVGCPVPFVTVAVSCFVPPPCKLLLDGLTTTVSVLPPPPLLPPLVGSKNTPLTTALLTLDTTLIVTFPVMFHTRYTPFTKFEIVSLSSTSPVCVSVTLIVSALPELSQSSAYTAT